MEYNCKQIYLTLIDETQSGTTTLSQSWTGSNGNEEVTPQ